MVKSTRWLAVPFLAVAVLGLEARDAEAQAAFGAQGNWGSETDFGLGGRVMGHIENLNLDAVGSFDIYFPDDAGGVDRDYWEINGNLFYLIELQDTRSVLPYVGGGLNIARVEVGAGDDTEIGLNLGGGVRFPTSSSITPFVEAKGVVSDFDQFVLSFGFLFGGGAR